ncbi:MAG: PEP-CTERM sorting domain-containing protein [Pirellulales bacterium]
MNTNGDDMTVTGAINGSGTFHTSGGLLSAPGSIAPRSIPGPSPIVVNSEGVVTNAAPVYDPAGVIVVEGDLGLTSTSVYEAEIGGTTLGAEYDNITVDGTAMLDGELHVVLFGGFVPSPGDTFEVLTAAGGISGMFANVVYPDLGFLLDWQLMYNANDVSLQVVSAGLAGDANNDGHIDGLDYLVWAGAYGTHPGPDGDPSDGDYNDDGWIDGLDYLLWAGNYGQGPLDATAVPEPGALGLLLVGMFVWPLRRRRS